MFMQAQQQQMKSQQAFMENLENQIGQLASALNNRPPSKLPSDTQVIRIQDGKESKAVELRSGKELLDLYKVLESESKDENGGHCT